MRNKKISADISKEASDILNAYCLKHERSKGYLLEKMIRKFCGELVEEVKASNKENGIAPIKLRPSSKKFKPPTVEDVFQYCNERCNNVDAQNFVDHYSSNGWMRGKNKIKDWKACVRTWEKKSSGKPAVSSKTFGNIAACEDFING